MCLLLKSKCLLKEERSKSLGHRRQKRPRRSGNPYSTGSRALCTAAWLSLCSLHFLVLAREIGTGVLCWAVLFRLLTELWFIKAT